jgi:hypothetical protein
MPLSTVERGAVSNAIFATTVVALLAVASGVFLLYGTRPAVVETTTVTSTDAMTHSSTSGTTNGTGMSRAVPFTPAHGQMFGNGWLIIAPLGNGSFAVSLRATGLEPAAMGDYIVEAAQNSGQMALVPIAGTDVNLSEFTADSHGVGVFFVILHQEPASIYESVSILYLPGMQMQNAVAVATAAVRM